MFNYVINFFIIIIVIDVRSERLCDNIDARNTPNSLFALRNCTAVLGYLQIVLMDNATSADFKHHVYPDLVEVTHFVLLYRVKGLTSLAEMFPNLQVIRGQKLLANYALIIYEMPDMIEVS